MLHDHESIIADDDYAEVSRPSREAYEIEVAYCYLEDRAAERAYGAGALGPLERALALIAGSSLARELV
jgi:hypothetical protein